MSQLLNSGRVGSLDKDRNSNEFIYHRWKDSGLLEGLDTELALKVALSMEIGANIILMENKSCDIIHKITGDVFHSDGRFDTVVFPIIRRIVARTPEAAEFIPEIINDAKKHYSSNLWLRISEGDERYIRHWFNNILPKWSSYHREKREHKDYDDYKKYMYEKHKERAYQGRYTMRSYEDFECVDIEAEFCAAMAEKIESEIREKLNIVR
jgi:hypothetical protein